MTLRNTADVLADYARIKDMIAKAENRVATLKKARDAMEQDILAIFEREGVQSIRSNGRTYSLRRDVYANCPAELTDDLLAALHHLGLDNLAQTRVLPQTLTAYVRERERLKEPIPAELQPLITVAEKFRVGSTAT